MSKSLKPFTAACTVGDVFRDEGGKLYLFNKLVRHTEDQSELVLLFDLTTKDTRDVLYPVEMFRADLTFTSRMLRPIDIPGKSVPPHQDGALFRHTDGGHYRFRRCARHAGTGAEMVVYDHVWPFDEGGWARPIEEFVARFTPITAHDLASAMSEDRASAQERITASRLARKGASRTPTTV